MLAEIALPDTTSCADNRALKAPLAGHALTAQTLSHMDRLRRVHGQAAFAAVLVSSEFVSDAVRNRSHLGFRQSHGHRVVTIQREKNREFPNVIVFWPHTATGSAKHQRRLRYNAITRAQNHCIVIVLGQGRLNATQFAPVDATGPVAGLSRSCADCTADGHIE